MEAAAHFGIHVDSIGSLLRQGPIQMGLFIELTQRTLFHQLNIWMLQYP